MSQLQGLGPSKHETACHDEAAPTFQTRAYPPGSDCEAGKGGRAQTAELLPGSNRDELLRKVRQAELAMHLGGWANSPGLQSRN